MYDPCGLVSEEKPLLFPLVEVLFFYFSFAHGDDCTTIIIVQ